MRYRAVFCGRVSGPCQISHPFCIRSAFRQEDCIESANKGMRSPANIGHSILFPADTQNQFRRMQRLIATFRYLESLHILHASSDARRACTILEVHFSTTRVSCRAAFLHRTVGDPFVSRRTDISLIFCFKRFAAYRFHGGHESTDRWAGTWVDNKTVGTWCLGTAQGLPHPKTKIVPWTSDRQ